MNCDFSAVTGPTRISKFQIHRKIQQEEDYKRMHDVMKYVINACAKQENIDRFCLALVVSKIHLNTLNETLQTTDPQNFLNKLFIY